MFDEIKYRWRMAPRATRRALAIATVALLFLALVTIA